MRSWTLVHPGHHRNVNNGLHVMRGQDDGQIVWVVWTADPRDGGVPVSSFLPTMQRAKLEADRYSWRCQQATSVV